MANTASAVLKYAQAEVGYLEKKSNANLDNKTANAGSNNYTKYGAWYDNGSLNGQPWCDMFVSWCAKQAGAEDIIGHFAYCPSHVNWFKKQNRWHNRSGYTPKVGDIIFFATSGTTACHVGIVYGVGTATVYTIEGNTSGSSGVVANGGGVFKKSYALTSSYILGYGNPAYTASASTETTPSDSIGTGEEWRFFDMSKTWKNGSTEEIVYADTALKTKVGTLSPYESCQCIGMKAGRYIVTYKVDGTESQYKVGYVEYSGGVK